MKIQSSFLSEEERKIIHADSIRILEEIGVKFPSEQVLTMLAAGGAKVDFDRQIAYISEAMVKKAVASAPKSFILGARNSEFDFKMPSLFSGYNLDGCGVNVLDFRTGMRRPARISDVADAARIFEEMDLGFVHWSPVSPSDMLSESVGMMITATSFMNTSKHVQDEVQEQAEVPYIMAMIKAIMGEQKTYRDRCVYSATYCTVAPLCHDEAMLSANIALSHYGVPILIYPMSASGTTGPASLYSNIAMANAESLSALVAFQLASPGAPIILGAALGVVNVRSGIFLEGTPETTLQIGAMGEMARYYGMPNTTAGCLTDAKQPGMQSVLEKTLTTLPLVLSGADIIQGIGLIESSTTLCYEHIVIDNEIAHLCKRIKDGIDVDQAKDYFSDIKEVGQGGHFLKQKNTRKAFRSEEFYQSTLCDRNSYDEWEQLGRPDLIQNSRAKIENILSGEKKNPMPNDMEKLMREIMSEAEQKLAE